MIRNRGDFQDKENKLIIKASCTPKDKNQRSPLEEQNYNLVNKMVNRQLKFNSSGEKNEDLIENIQLKLETSENSYEYDKMIGRNVQKKLNFSFAEANLTDQKNSNKISPKKQIYFDKSIFRYNQEINKQVMAKPSFKGGFSIYDVNIQNQNPFGVTRTEIQNYNSSFYKPEELEKIGNVNISNINERSLVVKENGDLSRLEFLDPSDYIDRYAKFLNVRLNNNNFIEDQLSGIEGKNRFNQQRFKYNLNTQTTKTFNDTFISNNMNISNNILPNCSYQQFYQTNQLENDTPREIEAYSLHIFTFMTKNQKKAQNLCRDLKIKSNQNDILKSKHKFKILSIQIVLFNLIRFVLRQLFILIGQLINKNITITNEYFEVDDYLIKFHQINQVNKIPIESNPFDVLILECDMAKESISDGFLKMYCFLLCNSENFMRLIQHKNDTFKPFCESPSSIHGRSGRKILSVTKTSFNRTNNSFEITKFEHISDFKDEPVFKQNYMGVTDVFQDQNIQNQDIDDQRNERFNHQFRTNRVHQYTFVNNAHQPQTYLNDIEEIKNSEKVSQNDSQDIKFQYESLPVYVEEKVEPCQQLERKVSMMNSMQSCVNYQIKDNEFDLLIHGMYFMKFGQKNLFIPTKRFVFVTKDLRYICWGEKENSLTKKIFETNKIIGLQQGRATKNFKRFSGKNCPTKQALSFSIIFKERSIDLEAFNINQKIEFFNALNALLIYKQQ